MYSVLVLSAAVALCNALSGQVELWKYNNQHLSLDIDTTKGTVNIVLTGDDTAWVGVGFNGTDMNNTYTFVADYDSDTIYELKLGSGLCSPQCDKQLVKKFTTNSNVVSNGVRTVNITRPINDNSGSDYYTFPTQPGTINVIWAFGLKGQKFMNGTDMQNQGPTTITLS